MTTLAPPRSATDRFADDELRVDGAVKVSGQAQYTADFTQPGMLWAAFVPSTMVHAKIVSVDTAAARAVPGVHAVLTGRDIGERYFGRRLCDWPVLSIDRVRFIGEYVAAVAAETPEIAAEAAALIEVEYEELPALFDTEEALSPDAIVLHEHPEKYAFMFPKRPQYTHKNIQGYGLAEIGDVEAGFAASDRIFEYTFTTPRYHGGYIEPRATLVWIDGDGTVHVVSTNKSPYGLREQLSVTTGLPKEKIVIHPSFIGGDFGAKGLSVDEFPCYYLAAATGRPVKSVRTFLDDVRSTNVRHASKVTVKTGVSKNGKFLAQSIHALYDGGAYAAGKVIPTMLPGPETKLPYGIPNQRLERVVVYTNTIPGGFVRAPGDVQVAFATESSTDLIAHELGIDPLELRLLNAARDGDLDIEGHPYREPGAVAILEALKRESHWGTPLPPGRGRGISLCARHIGGGKTSIVLTISPSGDIAARTGTTEVGMGILTVLQRVVGAELGIPDARVSVARGGTGDTPFDPGVGGSRTTHISGGAALDAARQLRVALEAAAATVAGVRADTMHLERGHFAADGGARVTWEEAAAALTAANGGTFHVTGTFDGEAHHGEPQYNNFAAYAIEAGVDRETGTCTIHDVVFVCDTGAIINPVAHRGQIDGGFMMGLGHAVTEELVVEEGRIVNLSFADYKLPTQRDMPPFRVTIIEESTGPGPFGARAVGEINVAGVGPALAAAVEAACGVRLTTLPITAERIYAALNANVSA
jgi:CO/xanthine dehydrogenase Mo-binding subunit